MMDGLAQFTRREKLRTAFLCRKNPALTRVNDLIAIVEIWHESNLSISKKSAKAGDSIPHDIYM